MPVVLTAIDDRGVATLTLNRPEVGNAYDDGMLGGIVDACGSLAADARVRALLLRGAGRHFQAGADLGWLKRVAALTPAENHAFSGLTIAAMRAIDAFPRPTIALVHGGCFGGGTGFVAACDIAVATEDAQFAISEVKFGVSPLPMVMQLARSMGLPQLRRWAITAERFDARRAERMGFVHELCAPGGLDAAAAPIVDAILAAGPEAVAETKRLTRALTGTAVDDALAERLTDVAAARRQSAEAAEGLSSFLEKRPPAWSVSPANQDGKGLPR
ncbi:MAG: enoyl-CoA hydratase-related protein [Alphaproteobacteria bacterium]